MKRIFLSLMVLLLSVTVIYSQEIHSLNSADNIDWRVQAVDQVQGTETSLSRLTYDASGWVPATVPGTYFVDFVNAGYEADPNYGDNIYRVDETKYNKQFWYRAEFEFSENYNKGKIWLHFKGVNKEGYFYLNGHQLGFTKGFMLRSKFDVTDIINSGTNVILVKTDVPDVRRKREPSWALDSWANFAMPTFMASASWDWMPYVPGLNCGLTNDVYLSTTSSVAFEDTWVRSALLNKNLAELSVETTIKNTGSDRINGVLKGVIMPGNVQFQKNITIDAASVQTVKVDKTEFSQLIITNPALWWPNGYGNPNLYTCNLEFLINDEVSDFQTVTFGIRKYDYRQENGAFTLYVNDSKVLMRGGNWGMTEYLQRSRGEDYDTRIKLHVDMNFNMIRLWTGCVTDDEFYQYCDKYGIMVWDDFWFHGHLFAPDHSVFMNNAIDKIKRLRNHPSIAVWCGANEGIPGGDAGQGLDLALKNAVRDYDGNDRKYQSSSNSGGGLSGSGWWTNQHPRTYFTGPNSSGGGDWGGAGTWALRTEIGTATFTTFESFQEFMPESSWWPPRNDMWNKHYFGNQAQTAGTDNYFNTVNGNYGASNEIDEFCEKSQYLNLEVMKAIYEGWNDNIWDNATGVLIWMSQSAYPSFVWQTYDYYFDATGAYWGAKKACEPLHIQWNYASNSVKVINTTLNNYTNLTAKATVYNLNGEVYEPLSKVKTLNSNSNTATECFILADYSDLNLALNKPAYASTNNSDGEGVPSRAVDGNTSTRWGSGYHDDAWFYVDLEEATAINNVNIVWEGAHGRRYLIQVSDNASDWTTVYEQNDGKGGNETIVFDPVTARYVKMQGVEKATMWGYSFYEFEVFAPTVGNGSGGNDVVLTDVNFIRLELTDSNGKLISDNFYWRNMKNYDYKALNSLPLANVSVTQNVTKVNGKYKISCVVKNNSNTVAFGNRLKVVNSITEKRILPIYMNDNYFTLMPNESKDIEIEFDEHLVGSDAFEVDLRQYGKYDSTPSSVKEITDGTILKNALKVYPNPATDIIHIDVNQNSIQAIDIYDMFGKLCYKGQMESIINISDFPSGMYVLHATVANRNFTSKFLKE
ncbi:MAG: hypothetical protein BGO29_06715 [Bacteroidales bacterium 36-12]|nr:MAG: hypothetical protein BGO29_06715 [Bacteroidales bacterium 36-12]